MFVLMASTRPSAKAMLKIPEWLELGRGAVPTAAVDAAKLGAALPRVTAVLNANGVAPPAAKKTFVVSAVAVAPVVAMIPNARAPVETMGLPLALEVLSYHLSACKFSEIK